MDHTLEKILARVQKPGRYVGGEYNAVQKDKSTVDCRFAFCFPDTYEIGMSNLGMRILYGVMNEMDGVWCERVFAPWGDMEAEMRREGLPLYALESGDPVSQFDIIGFSLGYEMAYTNVLNMLDLAGVPLRSKDRPGLTPLVIAGGTSMYNPEPLAPFVDIVSLGEGEDVTVEMIQLYRKAKREGWTKAQFLQQAAQIPGSMCPPCMRSPTPRTVGWPLSLPKRGSSSGDQADCDRHGSRLLPGENHCSLHGNHPGPGDVGTLPGLYPRLPLLPGGVRLPPCTGTQPGTACPAGHRSLPGLRLPGYDPYEPLLQRLSGSSPPL